MIVKVTDSNIPRKPFKVEVSTTFHNGFSVSCSIICRDRNAINRYIKDVSKELEALAYA